MTRSNPQPTPQNERFVVSQEDVTVRDVWTEEEMEGFAAALDARWGDGKKPEKP